jgi:hypothetical protein
MEGQVGARRETRTRRVANGQPVPGGAAGRAVPGGAERVESTDPAPGSLGKIVYPSVGDGCLVGIIGKS